MKLIVLNYKDLANQVDLSEMLDQLMKISLDIPFENKTMVGLLPQMVYKLFKTRPEAPLKNLKMDF